MIKIGFIGDTSFSGVFEKKETIMENVCDENIRMKLLENDYNVANLEGPLTEKKFINKKGVCLKSSPKHSETMDFLNINVLNLANNHVMDCGIDGLEDTISIARQHKWTYFGSGCNLKESSQELILSKNGVRVALLGVCHNEGMISKKDAPGVLSDREGRFIKAKLAVLQRENDWVIFNYHGGEEYTHLPMPKRVRQLHQYLKWGADIIIAHHSHVVQGFKSMPGKIIFFSLGDFIFDVDSLLKHEGTDESVIINLTLFKNNFYFEPIFTKMDRSKGTVCEVRENKYFSQQVQGKKYYLAWCRECYRVFFGNKKKVHNGKKYSSNNSVQKHFDWSNLWKIRTYRIVLRILCSSNSRPIFIGAIIGIFMMSQKKNNYKT